MDVAFIGLGQMGSGMAGRLIDAGHRVTVWNRDRARSESFERRGARIADNPVDAARSGIVLSMLANDEALEAVSFGDSGLLAASRSLLHVSCSTVSVALTQRLTDAHARAGQRFVSAQVLGRPDVRRPGACRSSLPGPSPTWMKHNRCSMRSAPRRYGWERGRSWRQHRRRRLISELLRSSKRSASRSASPLHKASQQQDG